MPVKIEWPKTPDQLLSQLNRILTWVFRGSLNHLLSLATLAGTYTAWWLYSELRKSFPHAILFLILVVLSACSALWLVIRNVRTRFVSMHPGATAALAIRGLRCYAEGDHALFWKLGRQRAVRQFGGLVQDTQSPLFALCGEYGAGKTSLLRAGLRPWLQQRGIKSAYCDLSGQDPWGALARAVAIELQVAKTIEPKALLNMETRAVLIIDSFEQFRPESSAHAPFLELLCAARDQPPPHTVQLVIAFRETYRPVWDRFKQRTGVSAVKHELPLLSRDEASDAIEIILEDAGISYDRSVVRDYIRCTATASGTLPVDLAIGAQAFESLARQRQHHRLHFIDYVFAGGPQGALLDQVRDPLENFSASQNNLEALTHGLAECLLEPETNKRLMSGASAATIAEASGLNTEDIAESYLSRLASPDTRILEALPSANPLHYRLARDSVAAALTRLRDHDSGILEKRINLFVSDRFDLWRKTQSSRDLLHGKILDLVVDQDPRTRSSSGHATMFAEYIRKSHRARRWRTLLKSAGCVAGLVSMIWMYQLAFAFIQQTKLESWSLPGELYARQDGIKSLRIQGYPVKELGWLQPVVFQDLEIVGSRFLVSLDGINKIRGVHSLTLDLTGRPVTSLGVIARLPGLATLKLSLGNSGISELGDLPQAKRLRELTLELGGSQISSIAPLIQMGQLETLRLQLAGSAVVTLTDIPKMSGLRSLTIDLDSTQLELIADLANALSLQELTLNIENPRGRHGRLAVQSLPSLGGLKGLRKFTLNLVPSTDDPKSTALEQVQPPVGDLGRMVFPDGLEDLAIDLGHFPIPDLPEFGGLQHLQRLSLHLCGTSIRSLSDMRRLAKLHMLDICLSGAKVADLRLAKLNLDELLLELKDDEHNKVKTAPKLAGLAGLRKLTLKVGDTHIRAINELATLSGIRDLELHLKWNQIAALPSLATLKDLQILAINLTGAPTQNPPPLRIQRQLSELTLQLSGTTLERIPDLSQFDGVKKLSLDLSDSSIQDLSSILKMQTLETLVIDLHNTHTLQQLPDLAQLKALTSITLILDGTGVQDLPDVSTLQHLGAAAVSLRNLRFKNLDVTRKLGTVREITLDQEMESLRGMPPSVDSLTFRCRP